MKIKEGAFSLFKRDTSTGSLTFVEKYGGTSSLDKPVYAVVSPDNAHVYVAASYSSKVAWFMRNSLTGKLKYIGAYVNGNITTTYAVIISPDGNNVYAVSKDLSAIVSFSRDK
ncbi:beta-propeller fold lactonase family protein [Spirochaetota bacterium]